MAVFSAFSLKYCKVEFTNSVQGTYYILVLALIQSIEQSFGMLIQIIDTLFMVYMIMLFARILGSWFPEFREHNIMKFLSFYTDPYLNFFRRFIPPLGMIDLSPIVAFLALHVIESFVKAIATQLFL